MKRPPATNTRVLRFLASIATLSTASEARAQVRVRASGALTVEGRVVARLSYVAVRPTRWTSGQAVTVAFALGGARGSGSVETSSLEVHVVGPMRADVGSAFEVVVRAGARMPVYAREGGRTYVALGGLGLPGITGLRATRDDGSAAALLTTPAALPVRLRSAPRDGETGAPTAQTCDALRVYARSDVRSATLTTEALEPVHVVGRRGPWRELWIERAGSFLVHGWARAMPGCERAGGVGGLGMRGSSSFGDETRVTLPAGLRFGATEQSATPWLTVTAATRARRHASEQGFSYQIGSDEGPHAGALTITAPVWGPRLAYARR